LTNSVLAHEVIHCALLHPFRIGQRDLRQFNEAADYAINNFLQGVNEAAVTQKLPEPFPLWKGALINPGFGGMSAEEIYALIQKPTGGGGQPNPNGQGQGNSGQGNGNGQSQPGKGGQQPPPPSGQGQGQANQGQGNDDGAGDEPASSPGEFEGPPGDKAQQMEQEAR
jgi:hypothetical protein